MRDITIWDLERRGNDLSWDGCNLAELARQYGTPLYVANVALLEKSHKALLGAFRAEGLEAKIFFSYKTNPVPDVLRYLAALGCGAEIISEFEFWLATRMEIAGSDIVVNGSVKSKELLRCAVRRDAAAINVESVDEIRSLQKIAVDLNRPVNVGLRINPCLAISRFDFTLTAGSRRSHIGFAPQSREWKEALRILHDESRLKLRGLHFHIGTGVRAARPYQLALETALKMWSELLEAGFTPSILDIGGGFSTPTLKEFSLLDAIRFFGWGKPPHQPVGQEQGVLLEEVARACSSTLHGFVRERGIAMPDIYVEPGRALVSSSHALLLKVIAVRRRTRGVEVAVCDAGAMSLSPQLLSEHHAVLVANKAAGGPTARYDLVGNLPAPLDLIGLRQELPVLEAGDVLVVMDVGAYFTSLGNNFAGPRPALVMIEKGVPRLARRRESFEDMVSRDVSMPSAENAVGRQGDGRA
jgi:diaminopimelate decarboxylase